MRLNNFNEYDSGIKYGKSKSELTFKEEIENIANSQTDNEDESKINNIIKFSINFLNYFSTIFEFFVGFMGFIAKHSYLLASLIVIICIFIKMF
jgi:hypothetical protein